jgi:hypothetical protein
MAETLFFNALREAIDEEMARDSTVFVLGEDVGHYGGSYKVTKTCAKKYGDLRVLDTPIAENSFTGMAVGAAMTGLRPIIEGMNMGFCSSPSTKSQITLACYAIPPAATSKLNGDSWPWGCWSSVRGRTLPATRGLLPSSSRSKDRCLLPPTTPKGY